MRKIFPEKRYVATGMKKEVDRCRIALDYAMMGKRVAFISSGDSGIYGMAGIMLEVAAMNNRQKKMGYNAAAELLEKLGLEP